MSIIGFPTIAALKRQVKRAWRSRNPRRWNRTFWREAKQRCGNHPNQWLEWLLDMEAEMIMNAAGPVIVRALEGLSPGRWQYHYRPQLLERIISDPWGLQRLRDEYQEIYSNGTATEADRVLELAGEPTRRALIAAA